ncbi:High mobility group [Coemansia sp. RSA 485]|nr:High mobility group [Coemansia sp. RSA 485]
MSAFNSTGSDVSTAAQQSSGMPLSRVESSSAIGSNYPLTFDPMGLQGSSSFINPGIGISGEASGNSGGSVVDESNIIGGPSNCSGYSTLPTNPMQLASGIPGAIGSNAAGFIPGPLPTQLHTLSAADGTQLQSAQGSVHSGMPLMPHMRPYNMVFGMPGLNDQRMLYDDRMQMPHPGGNWLRIRQPIDYVAPLKKPMNSFLLYSAERRVQLRQTHPDLNTTQQSTILAREWASLAEEEKEKYRAEAKQLRDDYNARRAELSLKLQQQLNQQHLNIGLSHPQHPPPPVPGAPGGPPRPQSQLASQQPSIDLLDVGMVSNNHEAHMHQVSHFGSSGFQQHFFNSGIQMPPNPPFTPATPGSGGQIHGQSTPPTSNPFDSISSVRNVESAGSVSRAYDKTAASSQFANFADFNALNNAAKPINAPDFSLANEQSSALSLSSQLGMSDTQREGNQSVQPQDRSSADAGSESQAIPYKQKARLSSPSKRTRKKSKKDPDAPKHPMSAFLYYLTSERPRLAEHLSDMSIGQQTKIIAKQWKSLNENDRAPWEKMAKHDKDRYARERKEYHGDARHAGTPNAVNTSTTTS